MRKLVIMTEERGRRVLDAAGELLLAHGYRKVTISDVAERAAVGKGTVYLHWPSKAELFATVLVREGVELGRAFVASLRRDPGEVLLHRTMRSSFLIVMARPLARALYTADTALLGSLITDTKTGTALTRGNAGYHPRHLGLMHRHGLIADDPATDPELSYRLTATAWGFFALDALVEAPLDLTGRADALATTMRRAFEPARLPDHDALVVAAAEIADLYDAQLTELGASLP
ncbi:TetR/AcrR family transcriptional regulator [Actinomycetospora termitidis]|uniref:Helix-turn-helix domain-containing protein n=1 Tax=Actinomycetospora termitidis TaxID=3053470 RepID=A0ABT7MEW0_9PSEU|nr:helix-turn-helix domain-containing protein [Actinomycetospora sp. Odt1-22]MDL5159204.1 helix-turn-helix domain-containing protein [Actinomycetospora sp. Odt1-22]